MIDSADVLAFDECIGGGGIAIFPADTVYGICCDPSNAAAIERLFAIKGRDADKPAAVMFFSLDRLLEGLPDLDVQLREALGRLLPGAITAVLPVEPDRFPLAARQGNLGVRVPNFEGELAALAQAKSAVLQSSANLSGGEDARRLDAVPRLVRESVDLQLDGGDLPGTPSTVVDLSAYASDGQFEILREGAVSADRVRALLSQG